MLLVEYTVLDKLQVINEGTAANKRLRVRGVFQKCDEQNNNGRVYPRKILESQVKAIQEKIGDRSLVGALDHPANDAIHLSQASHLITKLWVEKGGQVMGEAEILSTPNGKIVEALLQDNVKIGISSRGLGSVSEGTTGKIVNEDFKLITFDLVSDPSTKGAFPSMCESMRENSERAQAIVSKHKKDRVLITMLESKITEALNEAKKSPVFGTSKKAKLRQGNKAKKERIGKFKDDDAKRQQDSESKAVRRGSDDDDPLRLILTKGTRSAGSRKENASTEIVKTDRMISFKEGIAKAVNTYLNETGDTKRRNKEAKRERDKAKGRTYGDVTLGQVVAGRKAAKHDKTFTAGATVRAGRDATRAEDAANIPVGPSRRDKLKAKGIK